MDESGAGELAPFKEGGCCKDITGAAAAKAMKIPTMGVGNYTTGWSTVFVLRIETRKYLPSDHMAALGFQILHKILAKLILRAIVLA